MAGLSNTYENRILKHALRGEDFTAPANVYVDLHAGDPGEDGSANAISGDGHTRAKLGTGGVTTMSDATGLFATVNNGVITFTTLTADKGTATHFSLWDALSGGTCIATGTIPGAGIALLNGDTPEIAAGVLDVRMPGGTGNNGFGKNYAGKMLNKIFRAATFAPPANTYWAWFTADPGDLGAAGEVTGGGYSRVLLGTGGVEFSDPTTGQTDNDTDITKTASGADFGNISHYGIFDASSGGDLVMKGANDQTRSILDGETIKVLAGSASFTLD